MAGLDTLRRTSTAPEAPSLSAGSSSQPFSTIPALVEPNVTASSFLAGDLRPNPPSRTHSYTDPSRSTPPHHHHHHHHEHHNFDYQRRNADYRVQGLGRPLPSADMLRHIRRHDHQRSVGHLVDHPRLRPIGPAAPGGAFEPGDPWHADPSTTGAMGSRGTTDRWTGSSLHAGHAGGHPGTQYIVVTPEMLERLLVDQPRFSFDSASRPISRNTTTFDPADHGSKAISRKGTLNVPNDNKDVLAADHIEKAVVQQLENVVQRLANNDAASDTSDSSDSSWEKAVYPNPWSRFRGEYMREAFAEFLGTCILILFGNGVNCQVILTSSTNVQPTPSGDYLSISWGWGIGVGMGVWVAGGISGGHINPAVTITLATFRGFPWRKVPFYVLGQFLGAMTGALIVYINYINPINLYEGGSSRGVLVTGDLFFTAAKPYVTDVSAFFSEFLSTAVLLCVVLAIGDRNNTPPPDGLNPLVLLFLIVGIGACLGVQTAYGTHCPTVNPARDFGPRLATWIVGYGEEVFHYRNEYWLWTEWCATVAGGLTGGLIYDLLIYTGSESPVNAPWDWHDIPLIGRCIRPSKVHRPTRDPEAGVKGPQAETKMPAGEDSQLS